MAIEAPTPTRKKATNAQAAKTPSKPSAKAATNNPLEAKPTVTKAMAGGTMASYPGQSAESIKREQEYQTEDDMRTLHRAHQIRKDPARHGRVKAHVMGLLTAMKGSAPKVSQMAGNAGDAAGPDSELPQG